jgi:sugar-specific transcriptional regulator TrmB
MQLADNLAQIGLNEKQIEIYLALLQMGEALVQDLSSKTKIKRTTVYSILDILVQKGLAVFTDKGWHRTYYAENPKKVILFFKEKQRELKDREEKFTDVLPELASLYNIHATKPKIRYYEGVEGLKSIFEETLELKKGQEMLAYSSAELVHDYLDDYIKDYLVRRTKKDITQRAIVRDSAEARAHQLNDKNELRQTLIVPADKFPFSNEINIYANKLSIVSYKELLGIIIESGEIAKTQKAIFELAWLGAKNLRP